MRSVCVCTDGREVDSFDQLASSLAARSVKRNSQFDHFLARTFEDARPLGVLAGPAAGSVEMESMHFTHGSPAGDGDRLHHASDGTAYVHAPSYSHSHGHAAGTELELELDDDTAFASAIVSASGGASKRRDSQRTRARSTHTGAISTGMNGHATSGGDGYPDQDYGTLALAAYPANASARYAQDSDHAAHPYANGSVGVAAGAGAAADAGYGPDQALSTLDVSFPPFKSFETFHQQQPQHTRAVSETSQF